MFTMKKTLVVLFITAVAAAQSLEPPLSDTRLSVNTLVREDIFAGFLINDMERFARGEKNIETLLEKRPSERAELLAWKAGTTLFRAVRAYESKRDDEFQRDYKQALDLLSEARQLGPDNDGVSAITGGIYVLFADRLPNELRAPAWSQAYDSFRKLWKKQGQIVDKLPLHIKGELLGGLAASAQRTGHTDELAVYLDKITELLPGTAYDGVAKQWKKSPESAANTSITCLSCHEGGRLASRLNALNKR